LVIDELIVSAIANLPVDKSGDGTYNSLIVLSGMRRDILKMRKNDVLEFLSRVEGKGPKIRERALRIREILQAP
jgi:Ni,Fe-hydrogenase III large subunit